MLDRMLDEILDRMLDEILDRILDEMLSHPFKMHIDCLKKTKVFPNHHYHVMWRQHT